MNEICGCAACHGQIAHASDCAVHNAPALPVGPCNCGVLPPREKEPCSCYTPPNFEGCACGNSDDTFYQGFARGWNACLDAISKSTPPKGGIQS